MKQAFIVLLFLASFKPSYAQWTAIDSGFFHAIWLAEPDNGWSFGNSFRHWDGNTWTTVVQDSAFTALTCAFTSPNDGWVFGVQDSVYRFDGSVWTKQYTGIREVEYCDFYDANNGWLLSWDSVYNYQNGVWSMNPISLPGYIPYCNYKSISVGSPNTLWITGYTGYQYPSTDTTYILKFSSGQLIVDTAFANVYLYSICFSDQSHGWAGGMDAVTAQPVLFRYDNAGWHQEYASPLPFVSGITTIYMLNNNQGWYSNGSSFGALNIYGYNGITWSVLDTTRYYVLNQFSFADPVNGWALGVSGPHPNNPPNVIYSTSTGGLGDHEIEPVCSHDISIFPNPATDKISVVDESFNGFSLSLFNAIGMRLLKMELLSSASEIDISMFQPGFYIIEISSANRTVQRKIIIE